MAKILIGVLLFFALAVIGLAVANSRATADVGVKDGKLLPCPNRPNCVCSQVQDPSHFVKPLTFSTTSEQAFQRLRSIVAAMPGARLIEEGPRYLHFTFTSAVLRFVDDVEFLVEESGNKIQMRSTSRLGYSDFGVNRKRIEAIRSEFGS